MRGYDLREAMRQGRRVYGSAITGTAPWWPDCYRDARLDFVFIDTEHMPLNRTDVARMCRDYANLGLTPVVRPPSNDPEAASLAIDSGAHGVLAPYVETPGQVADLVGAVKLRPIKGAKIEQALWQPHTLEPALREYLDEKNRDRVLLINIESVAAMRRLDEMLEIPGLDGVVVGPYDMAASLGVPEQWEAPEFDAAVREVIAKARAKNLGAGMHLFWEGVEKTKYWADAGANILLHSADTLQIRQGLRREIGAVREALGD